MRVRRTSLVTTVALALALTACGGTEDPATGDAASGQQDAASDSADEPISDEAALEEAQRLLAEMRKGNSVNYEGTSGKTMGVVVPWFNGEGFQANFLGIAQQAVKGGISMKVANADRDASKAIAAMEDFTTQQVDLIMVDPFDSAAISAGIANANSAGIPVVAWDQPPKAGELAGMVASDNVAVGREAATLLKDAAAEAGLQPGDVKVLELLGAQSSNSGVDRSTGFREGAAAEGLEIVSSLPTEWQDDKANAAVSDGFQANPEINAIFMASGCAMYKGVQSALQSLGKWKKVGEEGHVVLISVDGCPEAMDGIREGYVDADSTQQLFVIGQKAGEIAVAVLEGNPPAETELLLPPLAATKDNVDSPEQWVNIIDVG